MNKWNRLLAMLDQVFGFENKIKSNFKKVSQDFDERTNEHVILIEYRVRVKGTMKSTPRKGHKVDRTTMLQKLYAQAKQNEQKKQK